MDTSSAISRHTLPIDAMEATTWGRQLQFGYDKDPFLNAWATELAIKLGGVSGWCTYLFSQLAVLLCFISVWLLAKKFLKPIHALIAAMMLAGIQYYNIAAVDFNDNVLLTTFWALTTYYFYLSLTEDKWWQWCLLGISAGLGLMAKYYMTCLGLSMLIFLLVNKQARKSFAKPGLYLSAVLVALVCAPHIYWLTQHKFITIFYVFKRTSWSSPWLQTGQYAWSFVWNQFLAFLLPLVFFGLLLFGAC